MSDDASGGWLRSIFRRPPAERPAEAEHPALPERHAPSERLAFARPAAPPAEMPQPEDEGPPPPATSAGLSYFRLHSTQGNILSREPGAIELGAQATLDPMLAVIAVVAPAQPHLCLIVAQDGQPMHVTGDTLTGVGISARLLRSSTRGIVRLKQPLSGLRFLTLEEDGKLRFDGPGTTAAAAFGMVPVQAADTTVVLQAIATEFGAAMSAGLRQSEVLSALRRAWARPELAEAVLRLLPRDELDDLARRLLDEPQTLTALRRMLPNDYFLQTALPDLVAWRTTRGPASPNGQIASPGTDETLILACTNEAGVSPGLALHALARGHVSPRRELCILAPARNEGPYLLEWLAYHLSIGFEHAFIYTNDNSDGSDALLALLARHGVITLVHNHRGQRIGMQEKANAHALALLPQILDYRWTAVIDLDEYIAFDAGVYDRIGDFLALQEAQPVDAVALNWLIFASRFGEAYTRGLTTKRFPWRADDVNRHVKTMFRTRCFWGSQPHYPYPTLEAPFNFRKEDGSPHHHPGVLDRIAAFSARPSAEHAWINHYIFRSAPEALWKLARGDVSWKASDDTVQRPGYQNFVTQAFTDFASSQNLIRDTRIAACGRSQPAMLEKLLSLPGVAETHDTIIFNFELQLKKMADRFLAAPVPFDASPPFLRFREALAMSQNAPHVPVVVPARSAVV